MIWRLDPSQAWALYRYLLERGHPKERELFLTASSLMAVFSTSEADGDGPYWRALSAYPTSEEPADAPQSRLAWIDQSIPLITGISPPIEPLPNTEAILSWISSKGWEACIDHYFVLGDWGLERLAYPLWRFWQPGQPLP